MFQTTLIFLSFALIHSIMIAGWFRNLCVRVFGETFMKAWYRFIFVLVSFVVVTIAGLLIIDIPDRPLWTAPPVLRWTMHAVQICAAFFFMLTFRILDAGEFLGIRQVIRYLRRGETAGNIEGLTERELVTTGVYGIVRHPMYVAGIVLLTCNPHVTMNSLAITVLGCLYFLFGMFIEERRFVKIFGDQYREYMQKVPRMVPRITWGQRKDG